MNTKNNLKTILQSAILGATILSPTTMNADDILKGVKGPTNWQLDLRESYTQKTDSKKTITTTTTNNDVIKYWSGDKLGLFGFINIPTYKTININNSKSNGFGDLTFGLGPRGRIDLRSGSFNFLSYLGASIPTGNSKYTPALGNGRTDLKAGFFTTTLSADKIFEFDTSFEYTSAGKNHKNIRGLDEITAGAIVGTKLTENNLARIGVGFTSKYRETSSNKWDYVYGPRIVLRITPEKKNWHFELIADYDLASKNMPKGYSGTAQIRINL